MLQMLVHLAMSQELVPLAGAQRKAPQPGFVLRSAGKGIMVATRLTC